MKTRVPAGSRSNRNATTARYSRLLFAVCLSLGGLVLAVATAQTITRPPFVGFIPDQRIGANQPFATKYFRIFNYETMTQVGTPTVDILENGLSGITVSVGKCTGPDVLLGCADAGITGYKVTVSGMPTNDGLMVVRVKARNMGMTSPYGYTSFCLRRDASGINAPRISNVPNRTLRLPLSGQEPYNTMFVIGDLTEDVPPMEDFQSILLDPGDAKSYNTSVLTIFDLMLLPSDDAYVTEEGPRDYLLTAKTPPTGAQPGVATLKVDVTDPDMPSNNTTSGSCVVQVSANSNAIPSFNTSTDGTYLVCPVPTPNPLPQYHYVVASNDLTSVTELRCQATSSNTLLVPNDSLHLSCSPPDATGTGTVSITPLLPLPTPGVPQASTITLTVTDELHTRQSTFLYIVNDPTSPALAFSRPSGVYSLDPSALQHREPDLFLTGEMHSVKWAQVEQGIDNYIWGPGLGTLNGDIEDLPIGMQANTPWSNPFMQLDGDKLTKTFNGSPNDGILGGFNTYHSEYLEVYLPDIDHAHPLSGAATVDAELWEGQLQSWHDYLRDYRRDVVPIEPPAGLDVVRSSGTDNVSWFAVHGAATYKLQQINFSTGSPTWTDVAGCNTAMTSCGVATPTGTEYGYRVRALNAAQTNPINWTYLGVFVSYMNEDGYVQLNSNGTKTVNAHATEPGGIQAGRGSGSPTIPELRGFLSFNTGKLGTATKLLGARLRIKQTTNNDGFDALGGCKVDIKKGAFRNNPTLMGTDFDDLATHPDVMRITPLDLLHQTPPDWTVSDLRALYKSDINTDPTGMSAGRTQLRLYFAGTTANKLVQWNAADSAGNEPYLLVQYSP